MNFPQARADVVYLNAPIPASGPPYPDVKQFFTPPFYEWWDAVEVSGNSRFTLLVYQAQDVRSDTCSAPGFGAGTQNVSSAAVVANDGFPDKCVYLRIRSPHFLF